jgi:hypothetical protein
VLIMADSESIMPIVGDIDTPPAFRVDGAAILQIADSGSASAPSPQQFRTSSGVLDMTHLGNRATFNCSGLDKINFKVVSIDGGGYPAGGVLVVEDTINGEDWDSLSGATNVTSTVSTQTQSALTCQGKQMVSLRVSTAASGSRLLVSFTGYKTT